MTDQQPNNSWPMWVLFFIFLVLKLTDTITWSWWWVTLPLWGGLVLLAIIVIFAAIIMAATGTRLGK